MQQAVRDSVAVLFDNIMTSADGPATLANVGAMKAVLSAGGVSHKDVSDWIRAPKSEPPASIFAGVPVSKTGWTPSPEAPLPRDEMGYAMDPEEALRFGLNYITSLRGYALLPGEAAFLDSLEDRFANKGRWLTERQLKWLTLIGDKHGMARIT